MEKQKKRSKIGIFFKCHQNKELKNVQYYMTWSKTFSNVLCVSIVMSLSLHVLSRAKKLFMVFRLCIMSFMTVTLFIWVTSATKKLLSRIHNLSHKVHDRKKKKRYDTFWFLLHFYWIEICLRFSSHYVIAIRYMVIFPQLWKPQWKLITWCLLQFHSKATLFNPYNSLRVTGLLLLSNDIIECHKINWMSIC